MDDDAVRAHAEAQVDAVVRAVDQYCPGLPLVAGVEIGHTDPQVVLPVGGNVTISPATERIVVEY